MNEGQTLDKDAVDKYIKSVKPGRQDRNLTAVIPIGGSARQMSILTEGQPKALLPVGPRPMLEHIIEGLDPHIFRKVIVTYDRHGAMVDWYINAIKGHTKLNVMALEIKKQLPQILKKLLDDCLLTDPFLLHYCDILLGSHVDWTSILKQYEEERIDRGVRMGLLMASAEYEYPVGVITLDPGRPNWVTSFDEKPVRMSGDWLANCAVALLSRDCVSHIRKSDRDIFGQTLKRLLDGRSEGPEPVFLVSNPRVSWLHVQRAADWADIQTAYYEPPKKGEDRRVTSMREKLKKMGILKQRDISQ